MGDTNNEQLMRRCILCCRLYQSDATVYAVAQPDADWTSLPCTKCESTIWYISNAGGACVSCWNCRYVNATNEATAQEATTARRQSTASNLPLHPSPPDTAATAAASPKGLFGMSFLRTRRRSQTQLQPARHRECKKEGLCSPCTMRGAGIDDASKQTRTDDKDKDDADVRPPTPPSPTSLESCITALLDTEWSLRRLYTEDEQAERHVLLKQYNRSPTERTLERDAPSEAAAGVDVHVDVAQETHGTPACDSLPDEGEREASPASTAHRLALHNTAIEPGTPESCVLSPDASPVAGAGGRAEGTEGLASPTEPP